MNTGPRAAGRQEKHTPLRALRHERKLSNAQVAEAAGITVAHLGNLERGALPIGKFSVSGLARCYKVDESVVIEAARLTYEAEQAAKLKRARALCRPHERKRGSK